jgi:outer membrane protein assembly factor BamB
VAVAAGGRVFKAFGHIAFKEREEPWLNTLAAFNGYNGTLLWQRPIPAALMVHRSTLIATADRVYFGDDLSCKVLDAATGEPRGEITLPEGTAEGTFWKWMALENGVLYALIGGPEKRDPVIRAKSQNHGWPWDPLSPGFNQPEHDWGFGRTLVAIDPKTHKVLWQHQEKDAIDSRALCMKGSRLYAFRFGAYLVCLDAASGKPVWRKTRENADELFYALGEYTKRQDWRTNWRTTAYAKCSDDALYFAGPPINKLLAVSTKDGSILWQHRYDNYQLVLTDKALYGLPGQIDKDPTRIFDPRSGKVLQEIALGRRACTRPTGSLDGIFCRANGGSVRLDLATAQPQLVSPMRPNCHDGVTIANGLLYWWPSVCDCNLTLYGITCLGPAGDFNFTPPATDKDRLQTFSATPVADLPITGADWPVFRANASGTVTTEAAVPHTVRELWAYTPGNQVTPSAPTAVDNLVFFAGSDGVVRALDSRNGKQAWKAYTGGDTRYPPAIAQGRGLVGSGDGHIYALEASTGQPLWRFRAAPVERRIPVYGSLQSTWPVGSGVAVHDGTIYAAAGIVNYDGTHVYALDLATGKLKWHNSTSGHLDPEQRTGVSVQGHLAVLNGKLYLPGGNAVSPAVYDLSTGNCLNDLNSVRQKVNNNVPLSPGPRGSELYVIANQVRVAGKPLYAHPRYGVYDASVLHKTLVSSMGDRTIAWVNNTRLAAYNRKEDKLQEKLLDAWDKPRGINIKALWQQPAPESLALAIGRNAAVIASASDISAYDLQSGAQLWTRKLPAAPVPWGLALTRNGQVIVTLESGKVLAFGS